jgi:hypothetical protein
MAENLYGLGSNFKIGQTPVGEMLIRRRNRYFVKAGPDLNLKVSNRYKVIGPPINVKIKSRYQIGIIDLRLKSRYRVNGYLDKKFKNRYHVNAAVGSNSGSVYYQASVSTGLSPTELATRYNLGDLRVNFEINTSKPPSAPGSNTTGRWDLTCVPYQFSITLTESQPATWSLNLIDGFGNYNPQKPGHWFEAMDEMAFAGGSDYTGANIISSKNVPTPPPYTLAKTLSVHVSWGEQSKSYNLIGTAWSSTRSADTKYFNFTWKGTDFSLLLAHEAQTMKTVRSSRNVIYKASTVLKEIFSFYKVKFDLSYFRNEDDYVIPLMHRQNGSPKDWVAQILAAMMYEWKFVNGDTFTPYLPTPLNLITPTSVHYFASTSYGNNTYTYDPRTANPNYIHEFSKMSIKEESMEGSAAAIYNRVVAIRAAEGGGIADGGTIDCFLFGNQYSAEFNPPLSAVTWNVVYANNGFFSNFKFYKGDALIATRDITIGSVNEVITGGGAGLINGCTKVQFTWGVAPGGFIGLGAPGKIEFHGATEVDTSNWPGGSQFDTPGTLGTRGQWDYQYVYIDPTQDNPVPGFRAMSQNAQLIQRYGLRSIEISASPLLPNKIFLQKFADRYLYRASRAARKATYQVPLNPQIEPGTLIREVDFSLGSEIAGQWVPLSRDRVVTTCTHNYSNDPAQRYTTYSGNEYVQIA